MTSTIYQPASTTLLSALATGFAVISSLSCAVGQIVPASHRELMLERNYSSYSLGNAGTTIHVYTDLSGDRVVDNFRPRTELGRRLLALRRAYVTTGGQLLDGNALDAEVQLRRGGVVDA